MENKNVHTLFLLYITTVREPKEENLSIGVSRETVAELFTEEVNRITC